MSFDSACSTLSVSVSFHVGLKKTIDCPCFIFADGKLDVFQHNKLLTSITVWTTFGELAILYNCTRTASVRGKDFIYTDKLPQNFSWSDCTFAFPASGWSDSLGCLNATEQSVGASRTRWPLQGLTLWPCGRRDQTSRNKRLMLCPIPLPPQTVHSHGV